MQKYEQLDYPQGILVNTPLNYPTGILVNLPLGNGYNYKSLDDMAAAEGVERVLEFLSYNPTQIGGLYRHTNIPVMTKYIVKSKIEFSDF